MANDNENSMDRRQMMGAGIAAAGLAAVAPAHAAGAGTSITETELHGRHALTLANGLLSLSALPGGGYIGDVHLVSKDPRLNISPLRVAHYPTIDPYTYDVARDTAAYGKDVQRLVMAGYMGHFTCFPQFGNTPDEFAATGYGQHGEAIAVKWERLPSPAATDLVMTAHLPLSEYNFTRAITLLPGETVAYVTETAENLTALTRPLQWVQHVTMGPPFVQVGKMVADGSVDKVLVGTGANVQPGAWPQSPDAEGKMVDYRAMVGTAHAWLMQRQKPKNWVTAYNPDYDVVFGNLYDAAINPWVLDWQTDRQAKQVPWDGKVVARGLCWGDSPSAGGVKDAVLQNTRFGVPTYSWIGSKATRSQKYAIFMAQVPKGWQGVGDVTAADGKIVITERGTNRSVTVAASKI